MGNKSGKHLKSKESATLDAVDKVRKYKIYIFIIPTYRAYVHALIVTVKR